MAVEFQRYRMSKLKEKIHFFQKFQKLYSNYFDETLKNLYINILIFEIFFLDLFGLNWI